MLTADRAREVLNYDPLTGTFTWRRTIGSRAKQGAVAGRVRPDGYYVIRVDGKQYYGHRLAWLLVYGVWPERKIDHRDLNKGNNRLKNLRQATPGQNNCNVALRADNTSGFKGVDFSKPLMKWRAVIHARGKKFHLGYFADINDAAAAYAKAANDLHKEFARTA